MPLRVNILVAVLVVATASGATSDGCRPLGGAVTYSSVPYDSPGLRGEVELLGADSHGRETEIRLIFPFACGNTNPLMNQGASSEGVEDNGQRFAKSIDGGKTWQLMQPRESYSDLLPSHSDLVRSVGDQRVLYRYGSDNGLFTRSVDGGQTWIVPSFTLQGPDISELRKSEAGNLRFRIEATSFSEPLTVFATAIWWPKDRTEKARLFGLYVSKDGGDSWRNINENITGVSFNKMLLPSAALALAPSNPSVMYGFVDGDVVKTIDAGATWRPLGLKLELGRIYSSASGSTQAPPSVLPVTRRPVTRRQYPVYSGLARYTIAQIAVDPTNENIVFVVADTGVYRSMDGGGSWVLLNLGFDELQSVNNMVIDSGDPTTVYIATRHGLYVSHNRGCHFERSRIPDDGKMLCGGSR